MPSTSSPLLDAIIQGWKDYQKQLVVVVQGLALEQFAIHVAPNLRTVAETITHLIAGRAFWFSTVLKEGNEEIAAMASWDAKGQPARPIAECVHGLEVTWNVIEDALDHWTTEELSEQIILPWIGPKYPITRSFVTWHILEHDLHHGGEATHALGMHGLTIALPPPPPNDP